jgi:hypothetical protein
MYIQTFLNPQKGLVRNTSSNTALLSLILRTKQSKYSSLIMILFALTGQLQLLLRNLPTIQEIIP